MALQASFYKQAVVWTNNPYLANVRNSGRTVAYWAKYDKVSGAWGFFGPSWWELGRPYEGGASHQAAIQQRVFNGTDAATQHNFDHYMYNQDGSLVGNARPGNITADQWNHYCYAFDAATGRFNLYVNGVLKINNTLMPNVDFGIFSIGSVGSVPSTDTDSTQPGGQANALYADLRVFDEKLDAADALALYTGGYSRNVAQVPNVLSTCLLHCPFIDDFDDKVSGVNIWAMVYRPDFVEDDVLGQQTFNPLRHVKTGEVGDILLSEGKPRTLIALGDSFSGASNIRLSSPIYNAFAGGKFGRFMAGGGISSRSGTASGTATTVRSDNNWIVEGQSTRNIFTSSYSNGVLTLTYNGPNLVVGDAIRIGSGYYTIASFTPGTGLGEAQTGAQITCDVASDPGNLSGQSISVICTLPQDSAGMYQVYNSSLSNSTLCSFSVAAQSGYPTQAGFYFDGALAKLTENSRKPLKCRLYHKVVSDISQQVKAVKIEMLTEEATYELLEEVSGLDNPDHAGQIRLLAEVTITETNQTVGGGGNTRYLLRVTTTDDTSDSANRYFTMAAAEFGQDDNGFRMIVLGESSWSFNGFGHSQPGFKMVEHSTIEKIVSAAGNKAEDHVITVFGDIENKDVSEWKSLYENTMAAWDAAFEKAGLNQPRYLLLGMYMHSTSAAISHAVYRGYFEKQNRGAMEAAIDNERASFFSVYLEDDGAYTLPSSEGTGVADPGAVIPLRPYTEKWNVLSRPAQVKISDATWDQATLTLTKTGGFSQYLVRPGASRIYVRQKSASSTPVNPGWYYISSITPNSITLTTSCTGGAAGVGADVIIDAIAVESNGLHTSSGLAHYYATLIASTIKAQSISPSTVTPAELVAAINSDAAQQTLQANAATAATQSSVAATQATEANTKAADIQKLAEADQIIEDDNGPEKLKTYERGTSTELIPAKTARQPNGEVLTNPNSQRLAGYRE